MKYELVWDQDRNDYYVGLFATLYCDGVEVWSGYSNDTVGEILLALGISFK